MIVYRIRGKNIRLNMFRNMIHITKIILLLKPYYYSRSAHIKIKFLFYFKSKRTHTKS